MERGLGRRALAAAHRGHAGELRRDAPDALRQAARAQPQADGRALLRLVRGAADPARAAGLIALVATACASPRAAPLFGLSGSTRGLGASTRLDVDGHWSWTSHSGDEAAGRISRDRLVRFRRLLADAE